MGALVSERSCMSFPMTNAFVFNAVCSISLMLRIQSRSVLRRNSWWITARNIHVVRSSKEEGRIFVSCVEGKGRRLCRTLNPWSISVWLFPLIRDCEDRRTKRMKIVSTIFVVLVATFDLFLHSNFELLGKSYSSFFQAQVKLKMS